MAFDAYRLLIATALQIEAADVVQKDIAPADLAGVIEETGGLANALQSIADRYGHAQAELRRSA
jgi:hypothetical protein